MNSQFSEAMMMKPSRQWAASAAMVLCVAASLGVAGAASAANTNPGVLPVQSTAFGTTYGQWSARWWQWALSAPARDNPVLDTTGANCAVGQSGPVWFLAGDFGGRVSRTCTVPAGRALFFPIINHICAPDPGETATFQDELACVRAGTALDTGAVEIDGRAVQNLRDYLVESPEFALTLSAGNVLGAPAGVYAPAAAAGIHLLLAPLAAGEHLIHFTGANGRGFALDVTYHLTVR
jgi:hypothetical protein